jgi:L-lactate dehydrogenase complex protein LldG
MNAARQNILARVRAAVRVPAHRPADPTSAVIWPPVDNPMERFRQEFTFLKGEIIDDLAKFLSEFPRIASDGSVPGNASVREADLGVTGCDCLVAQTGSIIVSCRSAGGRALSVLPPVHLVIARPDQLVADLPAAMALLHRRYAGHWPSNLSVISGPSRTADIEKILVMGAHGPKRLALYLAD